MRLHYYRPQNKIDNFANLHRNQHFTEMVEKTRSQRQCASTLSKNVCASCNSTSLENNDKRSTRICREAVSKVQSPITAESLFPSTRFKNVRKCLLGLMARNRTTVAFEVFKRKTRMPSSNFACRTAVKLQV